MICSSTTVSWSISFFSSETHEIDHLNQKNTLNIKIAFSGILKFNQILPQFLNHSFCVLQLLNSRFFSWVTQTFNVKPHRPSSHWSSDLAYQEQLALHQCTVTHSLGLPFLSNWLLPCLSFAFLPISQTSTGKKKKDSQSPVIITSSITPSKGKQRRHKNQSPL